MCSKSWRLSYTRRIIRCILYFSCIIQLRTYVFCISTHHQHQPQSDSRITILTRSQSSSSSPRTPQRSPQHSNVARVSHQWQGNTQSISRGPSLKPTDSYQTGSMMPTPQSVNLTPDSSSLPRRGVCQAMRWSAATTDSHDIRLGHRNQAKISSS